MIKILGPTADYLGEGLREWTDRGTRNVHRVFAKAERKLGPEALETEGVVPPRVLKGILEEGQFCENELGAEYLGGVLASSRTSDGRDDRGASLVALVGRLSTYQLRAHYIMYMQARRAFVGKDISLGEQDVRCREPLFLPLDGLVDAMDLSPREVADVGDYLMHTVHGLIREGLIENQFAYGDDECLRRLGGAGNPDFGEGGVIYRVTPLGIELFCGAHGVSGDALTKFKDPEIEFSVELPIPMAGPFGLVSDLPPSVPMQEALDITKQ